MAKYKYRKKKIDITGQSVLDVAAMCVNDGANLKHVRFIYNYDNFRIFAVYRVRVNDEKTNKARTK